MSELIPTDTKLDDAENFIVQKSKPLLSLWQSPLTLAEFKLLDAYLSRINSHDPSNRRVRFEKGELEALLGVTRINIHDLENRIQHLGIMSKSMPGYSLSGIQKDDSADSSHRL